MNVLFLARWYPFPADNGSKLRAFNLIRQLAERHTVDLVSFSADDVSAERRAAMRHYCRSVEAVRFNDYVPGRARAVLALASPTPRSTVDTYNDAFQRLAQQVARAQQPDLAFACEIDMAPYAAGLSGVPRVVDDIELTQLFEKYVTAQRLNARLRHGLTWWKLRRYVRGLLGGFAGCTVVSAMERARLQQVAPDYQNVELVPNGIDMASYAGAFGSPEPDTLVYAGSLTYSANFDAVRYFLEEIFPLIQRARPGVRFVVTGRLDGVPIDTLPRYDGVTFAGYLDDVRPTIARSWLSVVPLRQGSGTRLKILESLALGTPVVSTTKGAEGLDLLNERDLLIADAPGEFAAAVLRVLDDPALRDRLRANGRHEVAERYDWPIIGRVLCGFVDRVVVERAT